MTKCTCGRKLKKKDLAPALLALLRCPTCNEAKGLCECPNRALGRLAKSIYPIGVMQGL